MGQQGMKEGKRNREKNKGEKHFPHENFLRAKAEAAESSFQWVQHAEMQLHKTLHKSFGYDPLRASDLGHIWFEVFFWFLFPLLLTCFHKFCKNFFPAI